MNTNWNTKPLRELSERVFVGIASAATHAYRESGILLLRNLNIKEGGIDRSNKIFIDRDFEQQHKRKRLETGDVLTVRTGYVGISAVVPSDLAGSQCFTSLVTRPMKSVLNSDFLAHFLNSPLGEKAFTKSEAGGSQKNVNAGALEELMVPVPPIEFQKQIAALLTTWNIALQKSDQLISAKEQHLAHLRDSLLRKPHQSLRTNLSAVTQELTKRNGGTWGRDAIMAVTKKVGMRPMREETIAPNTNRYKLVPPRAFAYNPMRLNIGSIAMSAFKHEVLVSPDYVVFACQESKLLPTYLDHLRFSRNWKKHFELAGNGGVRVRIYYAYLGTFSFELPPLGVQLRIVNFLDAAAEEIRLLNEQAEELRLQKRGLMQKLLTGQWRPPLSADVTGGE